MSIILNQNETERYINKLPNESQNILPVSQPKRPSTDATIKKGRLSSAWSFARRVVGSIWTQNGSQQNLAVTQPGVDPDDGNRKESYFCIDKCWTSIEETNMSTISSLETMSDDAQFFRQAQEILKKAQGGWIQRFLSWRSYTRVCLTKVTPPPD
jgi:hypothetical protein